MTTHESLDPHYVSYMLRMWRKRDENGRPMWCASLEEPGSHRMEGFADSDALFSFLQRRLNGEEVDAQERVPVAPENSSTAPG